MAYYFKMISQDSVSTRRLLDSYYLKLVTLLEFASLGIKSKETLTLCGACGCVHRHHAGVFSSHLDNNRKQKQCQELQ